MILILSNSYDQSTGNVIKWLKKYKANFLRINDYYGCSLIEKTHEGEKNEIKTVWFRRSPNVSIPPVDFKQINSYLQESLEKETKALIGAFFYKIKDIPWLNHPAKCNVNKLVVNQIARQVGLKIPDSIITTQKQHLLTFVKQHSKIITKPMYDIVPIDYEEGRYVPYTEILDEKNINGLPAVFKIGLFQEYIEKIFEIRVFVLYEKLYSMAILSQGNKSTASDFRNIDWNNPNRDVPYKLPNEIEEKILKLVKILSLESCSIDIIRSKKGEFIFLEVNPVGQFGMTSFPCNYYIEKEIALKLIENEGTVK